LRLKLKLTQTRTSNRIQFQNNNSGSGSDRPPGRRRLGRRRCRCGLIFRACRGGRCHRRQGRFRQGPIQPWICAQSEFGQTGLAAWCRRTGAAE